MTESRLFVQYTQGKKGPGDGFQALCARRSDVMVLSIHRWAFIPRSDCTGPLPRSLQYPLFHTEMCAK
ncbi:MAG: hypothetical protein AAGJ35_12165, partial [Myxococcota bacterium]